MGIFVALFFLFLGVNIRETISQQNEGLTNFLRIEMENFPSWIAENGLDPSPIIPDELNFEYSRGSLNITMAKMRNQVVSGYSKGLSNVEVSTSLIFGNIHMNTYFLPGAVIVTGEYEVEGSVFSTIPITGTGKFNYTCFDYYDQDNAEITLSVDNFAITEEGYIDLSAATVRNRLTCSVGNITFENLSAGGYESEVEKVLRDLYAYEMFESPLFPLPAYLLSYLEELFAKTPISEIIDTTLPPTAGPETTAMPIETTSESPPCKLSVIEDEGTVILKDKVLQKNVTVNEQGEMEEIIAKLVILKRKM